MKSMRRVRTRRELRRIRGQAMVEYSLVTLLLLMGAVGGGLIVVLPAMLNALNTYLTGIYFLVSAAIP